MRHRVPFQCSAKDPEFELPTAVHAEDELHTTLAKKPPPAEGLGVAWMRTLFPYPWPSRAPQSQPPAEVPADAATHATLWRKPPPAGGMGVAWMRHLVPFHRSASGTEAP